jgi:hypothetical protein
MAEQRLTPPTTSPVSVPPPWTATSVPSATPEPGEPGRLQHIQMLRDSGLLTPEEFEILKNHLPPGSA